MKRRHSLQELTLKVDKKAVRKEEWTKRLNQDFGFQDNMSPFCLSLARPIYSTALKLIYVII